MRDLSEPRAGDLAIDTPRHSGSRATCRARSPKKIHPRCGACNGKSITMTLLGGTIPRVVDQNHVPAKHASFPLWRCRGLAWDAWIERRRRGLEAPASLAAGVALVSPTA